MDLTLLRRRHRYKRLAQPGIASPWLGLGGRRIMVVMDRELLADFLRNRRESLQPEDVGLARGARRRTTGLRREEVALLASMSTDYYARLAQKRGPKHTPPYITIRSDHVAPGLRRVLDRLETPAMITNDLGEVLAQNPLGVALFGDESRFKSDDPDRSRFHRWFTDPRERDLHPAEEHDEYSRSYVAVLRTS